MTVWDGWRFYSEEALTVALDTYARFRGQAQISKRDACPAGEDWWEHPDDCSCTPCRTWKERDLALRANKAVDKAMLRLRYVHGPSYRLLDSYYRSGGCDEASGWQRALQRSNYPSHPQTQRERMILETFFDELKRGAINALFLQHTLRHEEVSKSTSNGFCAA